MRGRVLSCSALFVMMSLIATPSAVAEEHSTVVDDEGGDVRLYVDGNDAGSADATHRHIDLLSAWIANETQSEIEVGVRFAEWQDPYGSTALFQRILIIGFTFKNESFVTAYGQSVGANQGCSQGQAVFAKSDNEELAPWYPEECLDAEAEPAEGAVHITVPKQFIRASDGVAVQAGDRLTNFFGAAWQLLPGGRVHDRVPDTGYGGDYRFTVGLLDGRGDLTLAPVQPIRSSNGESTTMLFPVRLGNHGSLDDTVILSAADIPAEWTVRFPEAVKAPAGEEVLVPVVLSMEFTHEHGVTKTLRLTAESTAQEGDYAQTDLGVHWLEIPQPSGHHPFLWLHSAPGEPAEGVPHEAHGIRRGWFNGIEDDPRATADDEPVGGASFPPGDRTAWGFHLDPGLQLGLDLAQDPLEPPYLDTAILATVPATEATLSATVYYCDPTGRMPGPTSSECGTNTQPGTRVPLFDGTSKTTSMGANSATNFLIELAPNADLDVIPYEPGSALILVIVLQHDTPQSYYVYGNPPTARIAVDRSILHLPLEEYHDPVDKAFANLGSITLEPVASSDRSLNAGRTAAFEFRLANQGDQDEAVRLGFEGINADWAQIHGPTEFQLEAGASETVLVAVTAPEGAQEGERAELFLVAQSTSEEDLMALARFRATVVDIDRMEIPDEAGLFGQAEDQGSASFLSPSSLAVGILAAAALFRRSQSTRKTD